MLFMQSARYAKASSYDIRSNFLMLQEATELLHASNSKQADHYEKLLEKYYGGLSYLNDK